LDSATRHDRPASERYREIMRPLGLGDELRAALIVGGQCWGYLCLHREDHERGFTATEAATLARVSPHIAQALRTAMLVPGAPSADPTLRPGVVLLADDLSVVAMTPEAEHLLSLLEPGRLPLPTAVVEPVEPRAAVPLMLAAHGLSPREAEVAALVLRGNPARTIADRLHISANTVQDHLKAVFDKTGVRSRRDLVALLLSPPS
jgi:DNA-binding CsgD family transcriptional regulator